jgi:hypothetical protein
MYLNLELKDFSKPSCLLIQRSTAMYSWLSWKDECFASQTKFCQSSAERPNEASFISG